MFQSKGENREKEGNIRKSRENPLRKKFRRNAQREQVVLEEGKRCHFQIPKNAKETVLKDKKFDERADASLRDSSQIGEGREEV